MKTLTRRELCRGMMLLGLGATAGWLAACRQRVVQVEKVVEKEVTKIVKETVEVRGTPQIVEKTVEKVITAAPVPKAKVVIVADVMDYGWTQFAMLVSPAFEELFPNVTIAWHTTGGWTDYPARVASLAASAQLGDLLEAPAGILPARWVQKQIVQPLDEIIKADGFDTSGIFKAALSSCQVQGKQYGLPFMGHAGENVLLYATSLFDKARVNPPSADWTLTDLEQAASLLSQDLDGDGKLDQFGVGLEMSLPRAYPLLHLFGGELLAADGKQCLMDREGGLAMLRWVRQMIYERHAAPRPAEVEGGPLEMLRAGRLAMMRQSFRTLVDLEVGDQAKPKIAGALSPRHPTTGRVGTLSASMAYFTSRDSPVAHEVFQWMKYFSSREMGVQMFLGGYGDPGCRVASWKDPRVVELYPLAAQIASVADSAAVERLPWNLRLPECLSAWERGMAPLLLGETPPEECAAEICQDINIILAQPLQTEDER